MFFRLTPARRVLLLIALALVFSNRTGEQSGRDAAGPPLVAALCLLVLLALEVADRVAMKRDLEVAREIQNWLVPQIPPKLPDLDIAFVTRPANTVAGDYYDVLTVPASDDNVTAVLFVVADVAGKGIPAGLLMACFRSCLHTLASTVRDLSDLAARLNSFCVADSHDGRHFTTAFLAKYEPATSVLSYVNAGHNPPLLRHASGVITELEASGLPCGSFAGTKYETGRVMIACGDLLLIYTDGVIEAVNDAEEEFGLERLRSFLARTVAPSERIRERLIASIDAFVEKAPQHDDITCMVVQFAR